MDQHRNQIIKTGYIHQCDHAATGIDAEAARLQVSWKHTSSQQESCFSAKPQYTVKIRSNLHLWFDLSDIKFLVCFVYKQKCKAGRCEIHCSSESRPFRIWPLRSLWSCSASTSSYWNEIEAQHERPQVEKMYRLYFFRLPWLLHWILMEDTSETLLGVKILLDYIVLGWDDSFTVCHNNAGF